MPAPFPADAAPADVGPADAVSPGDVALALALADAAGAAIRPWFRRDAGLERKGDHSPVTRADRAAEGAMRRLLAAERPGDGVHGEEYGIEPGTTGRLWVLDPIDGTHSFVAGRAIFGTLVALVADGRPVLGIIDQPVQAERWLGVAGRPTTLNGAPARTRACGRLAGAELATTSPHLFAPGDRPRYDALAAAVTLGRHGPLYGGDCYNYALLASGHLDLVCESGLLLHDWAALVPVVEGAGGWLRDWQGAPLTAASAGQVLALGDPALAEAALAMLAG